MKVVEYMERYGFEQLCVYTDPGAGLRAFIAIHDTTLGPALGGCRIWPHRTEEEAVEDVLRLARAMTYKSAAAGLPLGGGKALIMADPRTQKTEALLRAFGRFVDTLGGRYITTEDVGTVLRDMEVVRLETEHVLGLPTSLGGSGDPSVMTGLGVYMGMKAAARAAWGEDSLAGRRIAIQGFGKVASNLAAHLVKEEAQLVVTDIHPPALEAARRLGAATVEPEAIYDVECDVFAPCALGGVLNRQTIPRLRCRVVTGGANNQLQTAEDGEELERRGILYAPDYIVNAGGVINISCELGMAYSEELARQKTLRIYETVEQVIALAKKEGISTAAAADRLAEARIQSVARVKRIYR